MSKPASNVHSRDRSTCQWLAQHAHERPTALAVVHQAINVTYCSLASHVLAVMDDLGPAGIRQGQVIGVEAGDRYLHLLVLLAAEALGITTMSLTPSEVGPPAHLDRLCDRIIVSKPVPMADPDKLFVMPPDWISTVLERPASRGLEELERSPKQDAIVRLIRSSGTTGMPKVMGMTHRVQQGVIQKALLHAPSWVTRHPNYLCIYNFAVRASHTRALLTLQSGGTVYLTGSDAIWDLIAAGIGNYVMFVAGDLERFVRTAPQGSGPFALYLDVIGASVPPRLRQEVRTRLTEHIVVTYSSNEVNRISVVDEDNIGTLFPDVRIRIVGEQGMPVPAGQTGSIWVKTKTMTEGYINAPDLTRASFIDGWFHTSDIGFQPSAGKLVVLGRGDDILNIGGLKIAPGPIEQRLKLIGGVRDALVTSTDDHLETRIMLVAIERSPDADPADLTERITPLMRSQVAYFQLLVLPAFPRTETGKIKREAIKEIYQRQAQSL